MVPLLTSLGVVAAVAIAVALLLRLPPAVRVLAGLRELDRRWIFLFVWILVMAPLIWPLKLPVAPTARVKEYYDQIDKLAPGDLVLLSADFDPASAPELIPMLRASLLH